MTRNSPTLHRVLLATLSAFLLAGCSQSPQPKLAVSAEPWVPIPPDTLPKIDSAFVDTVWVADSIDEDLEAERKRPRRPAEPEQKVVTGASSSAAPANGAAGATPDSVGAKKEEEPLAPQLPESTELALQRETRKAIDETRSHLAKLDESKLDEEKKKKLKIATDFLVEAERALEKKEYERAAGLATKARLLTEELSGG